MPSRDRLSRIEDIVEAARRIPSHIGTLHPEIAWREMGDWRNAVIHEYFGVDPQIIWETILHGLPPLAPVLRTILAEDAQTQISPS